METSNVPVILTVGSIILLAVFFFAGRNAVWGGATLGLVIGLVVGLVKGDLLNMIIWGISIGTFAGFAAELLGRLGDYLLRKSDGN